MSHHSRGRISPYTQDFQASRGYYEVGERDLKTLLNSNPDLERPWEGKHWEEVKKLHQLESQPLLLSEERGPRGIRYLVRKLTSFIEDVDEVHIPAIGTVGFFYGIHCLISGDLIHGFALTIGLTGICLAYSFQSVSAKRRRRHRIEQRKRAFLHLQSIMNKSSP